MKKMMVVFLSMVFLICLCACGDTTSEPSEEASQSASGVDAGGTDGTGESVSGADDTGESAGGVSAGANEPLPSVAGYVYSGETQAMPVRNRVVYTDKDGEYTYSFRFAQDGSSLRVDGTDPDGAAFHTVFSFQETGELRKLQNGSGSYVDYVWNENTQEVSYYLADGSLGEYTETVLREDDKIEKILTYDGDEQLTKEQTFTYDENGYLVRQTETRGEMLIRYEITNGENGKSKRTLVYTDDMFYAGTYSEYDEDGNKIYFATYDDEAMTIKAEAYRYEYTYNEDGTLALLTCTRENGAFAHSTRFYYEQTMYPHYAELIAESYFFD